MEVKLRAALHLISRQKCSPPLALDDECDIFKQKYPEPEEKPVTPSAIASDP